MNKKSPTPKKRQAISVARKATLPPSIKRVPFIDGMRGVASVLVVFYHTLLSFYPGVIYFDPQYSHTSDLFEKKLTLSVFNLFYSGSFAVCMFFVISGYALSYSYFKNKNTRIPIIPTIIRRYFRLEIPILFSIFLSFILLSLGVYTNLFTAMQYTKSTFWLANLWNIHPSFWEMLKESVYTTILKGGSIKYNTVLWTMCIEFIGSILVFIILAIFGRLRIRYLFYLIILILVTMRYTYLPAFVIGLSVCDFYISSERKYLPLAISIILFASGIYIGSYQTAGTTHTIWSILDWLYHTNKSFPYIIGASLVMIAVINTKGLQRFFASKPIQFFGKISFPLYLIHVLVLGSLSCFLFKFFYAQLDFNYLLSFLCTFTLSFAFMLVCSYYIYKYIDRGAIRFSQKIYNKTSAMLSGIRIFQKQEK